MGDFVPLQHPQAVMNNGGMVDNYVFWDSGFVEKCTRVELKLNNRTPPPPPGSSTKSDYWEYCNDGDRATN